MRWGSLTRTAAPDPDVEVLSLADLKAHLRVDASDQDALLQSLIAAAIATVEGPTGYGLVLITQTWRLSLDRWPREVILGLGPVQSVESITYIDAAGQEQTLDPAYYVVDTDSRPARITPAPGADWPAVRCQPGAIKITFIAGFGDAATDVLETIRLAMKMLAAHWFTNPLAVMVPERTALPSVVPLGVEMLLAPHAAQVV